MSLAQAHKSAPFPLASGVQFVPSVERAVLCSELLAQRCLVAEVEAAPRGMLRQAIEEAVEGVLAASGGLAPALSSDAPVESTIRDQAFRVRALGAEGLALVLPNLVDAQAREHGIPLDADDSAALSAWIGAARRAPVSIVLDETDRNLRLLLPVSLADLVAPETSGGDLVPGSDAGAPSISPPPPVLAMPRRASKKKATPRDTSDDDADHAAIGHTPEVKAQAVEIPTVGTQAVDAPDAQDERDPPSAAQRRRQPVDSAAARRVVNAAEWRSHALELDKARGPKPVSAIDRLFCTRYVPLLGAVNRGDADPAIKSVVDGWRANFEHSYRDAFSALRVTGKRPPMVFDAPDIAARIGRLNGARGTKLFLVDAMRYDLGERVADRLQERLVGRAVCIEKVLLWAALPTSTPTQLALLARGPDALRDAEGTAPPEGEIVRGRAVTTVRRERVGSREIMKLDVLEARLRLTGPAYDERLDALADEVVPIVVKFVETLAPRTLLFVFGDHGFRFPASPDPSSTGPVAQGGCSPEEVLVPGQAWLVGGVH